MSFTKRLAALAVATALALALPLSYPAVSAQDATVLSRILSGGRPAPRAITADDTDVALYVRYIGDTAAGGTVTVASNGDITFAEGAVGASAAEDTLECPVSGALGGIIDVSDSACDTLGEVADIINGSSHWIAFIKDGFRSSSSNDTLNALSETAANTVGGLGLVRDTSVAFDVGPVLLSPEAVDLRSVAVQQGGQGEFGLIPNPFQGRQYVFLQGSATSTYGSGTSTLRIYQRCVNLKKASAGASEVVTQLWQQPGGATTVAQTFTVPSYGIVTDPGCALYLMIDNSAAASSVTLTGFGTSYKAQP